MSDDEIKNLMGRAKDYLGKLDDTAKGGSRGDEAQHIWKLIQSTIIGRPKIAGD